MSRGEGGGGEAGGNGGGGDIRLEFVGADVIGGACRTGIAVDVRGQARDGGAGVDDIGDRRDKVEVACRRIDEPSRLCGRDVGGFRAGRTVKVGDEFVR